MSPQCTVTWRPKILFVSLSHRREFYEKKGFEKKKNKQKKIKKNYSIF